MSGRLFGGFLWGWLVLGLFPAAGAQADAQPATVAAVMLSDLHLDPFHDPAKVPFLLKAPVEQWEAILKAPDSPTQQADFAAVQKACKAKNLTDAPYALLTSALQAARALAPQARFVTVSGDLLVHNLDCRYRASLQLPKATGDDQSLSAAFAEKLTVFVMKQVEQTFAGLPVYLALGNNDSRCNHNRMDVRDPFLQATGPAVIDGLVGVSAKERKLALATYDSAGYYAVTMAAPMERTRLLVLDDVFMMSKYENCEADSTDTRGADEQMAWLTKQLDAAQKHGERVWVLGHVPPAVDPSGSLLKGENLCAAGKVATMLSTDALATTLASHASVVRLALFGHTHMDELHLLGSGTAAVPVKVVASVTPVDGNKPSFTLGKVDPRSATLLDYTVYEASNPTGVGTAWAKEYAFDDTYRQTRFTAQALQDLIGRFRADTAGACAESQSYQQHFFKGAPFSPLALYWPAYVCSLNHSTADGFKACVCGGK